MKGIHKNPGKGEPNLSQDSASFIEEGIPVDESVEAVERVTTVPAILKVMSELTGMRYAVVARVTDNRWIACAVLDRMDFGLPPGGELEVASTLCSEVRDQKAPIVIEHASKDTVFCNHPTPKKYGIESYIAVPIVLESGEFFGTENTYAKLAYSESNRLES